MGKKEGKKKARRYNEVKNKRSRERKLGGTKEDSKKVKMIRREIRWQNAKD